jgi:Mg-chelatase subunit ChlD
MAFTKLGSTRFMDESCEREAAQAFSTWEAKMAHQQKILEGYKDLLAGTRFSAAEFPREDYTEYLRSKELLSGPIRRVLEKLRLLKNITGEDFRQESGLVDLQEAIQIIASKSQRTDIFVREEYQTREEAWAIVIDASHSLDSFLGEVRGIALCLAETAKNLILNRAAWGVFAFNDEFYIIKDFSENYSTHVRARIGGLKQKGLTYLPDGLKVAKNAMQPRIEQAKIIVAVSDFFPSGDLAIENELIQDLKQMERSGMGLIGVGVKSRAVKNYFRCNCVVETPYDLMKSFTKAFLEYSATV